MWDDLFAALALLLVFEGIVPFINPARWREYILKMAGLTDLSLRIMGFISMLFGIILLYLIRSFSL